MCGSLIGQCGDGKCEHENFHMDVIKAFHVHIMFRYDEINTSCQFSLHTLARWGGEGEGGAKENPNPCHALPLKIQRWGVVEIGVSCKARKGTWSFSIVMKCLRESRKGPLRKCTRDDRRHVG